MRVLIRSWVSSIQTYTYFENGRYWCDEVAFAPEAVPFVWDNAELYTGLRDTENREIFEGDVVSCLFERDSGALPLTGEVMFEDGKFVIVGDVAVQDEDGAYTTVSTRAFDDYTLASCEDMLVVGSKRGER